MLMTHIFAAADVCADLTSIPTRPSAPQAACKRQAIYETFEAECNLQSRLNAQASTGFHQHYYHIQNAQALPVVQVIEAHNDMEAPAVELAALLGRQGPIAHHGNLLHITRLEGTAPFWHLRPAHQRLVSH